MSVRIMLYSPFSQSKSYSKDFLMYDHGPGGLLVVFVICHCVNTTDAKMETARSVEEDGCEIDASVGCKAEGKSTAVTP